jgi:hypothetical protein
LGFLISFVTARNGTGGLVDRDTARLRAVDPQRATEMGAKILSTQKSPDLYR